ncbi:outer membrane lipoprotein-sorting protein [Idiomarina sp. HP20-50]|uniref:outer membrane lipoprotein-sorting protein n=1 Tax=Idiomarina sp. HP20-50 TaxID=3070813 RepID=UPI00294B0511|nr:outer membrane lipoprotein-sorting protein [Idiomarina sp. HP20-50]MDV6316362.1 outer membrane lipoprotein-sorting protein [Idiomarina sp. HP20-50]
MKTVFLTVVSTAFLLLSGHTLGAEKSARDIVEQAELNAYYAGDDGRSAARMIITDSQGRQQLRQFTILRKDKTDGGVQDLMVFFSRPADVRDTVFRVVKQVNSDDDRWLYLPDLDLVKRISAGDKRTSFVGSHFFYEDVSGRDTALDNYEILSETDNQYVLKGTPKTPGNVEFAYYHVVINKEHMLPVESTFYNDSGEAYRKMEVLKIETIQGHPTVTHSRISDLNGGGNTEMQFRFITYNIGLPDSIFSERSLRNPPVEWLTLREQ